MLTGSLGRERINKCCQQSMSLFLFLAYVFNTFEDFNELVYQQVNEVWMGEKIWKIKHRLV